MARQATAPVTPLPAGAPPADTVAFKRASIEDVKVAVTKARAGWWLLDAMNYGYLPVEDNGPEGHRGAGARTEEECDDLADWLEKFALEAIEEALIEVGDVVGVPFGETPTPRRRQAQEVS